MTLMAGRLIDVHWTLEPNEVVGTSLLSASSRWCLCQRLSGDIGRNKRVLVLFDRVITVELPSYLNHFL